MKKTAKFNSSEIKVIGDHLPENEDVSEMVTRMEREADEEILGGTVTLRWGKDQIGVVKRAAAIMGVPYQTYLKQVVFRQALADIEQAKVLETPPRAETKRRSGPARLR